MQSSLANFELNEETRKVVDLGRKKPKIKHSRAFKHEERVGLLFILIPIIGFCTFVAFPTLLSIYMSLTNYDFQFHDTLSEATFIGFQPYIDLFKDEKFWNALLNTVILLASIPVGITLGLLIATYINRVSHGSKVLSLLYYLPAVTSVVAVSIVWRFMFFDNGIINSVFGLHVSWMSNTDFFTSKIAILIKGVWGGLGGTILLFLAGLNNIPNEYYEASSIDGASTIQQFVHITLPHVNPTIFYLLVTNIIGHLQAYADTKFFTVSAIDQTRTAVYYMWEIFDRGHYSVLGAASTFIGIIILIITIFQFSRNKQFDI